MNNNNNIIILEDAKLHAERLRARLATGVYPTSMVEIINRVINDIEGN